MFLERIGTAIGYSISDKMGNMTDLETLELILRRIRAAPRSPEHPLELLDAIIGELVQLNKERKEQLAGNG
jgi:hypothetical protein